MTELQWYEFWGKKLSGIIDITHDINEILSGNFFVISENVYKYPHENPRSVCATEDCIFEVEGRYYAAEKDQILVIYGNTRNV